VSGAADGTLAGSLVQRLDAAQQGAVPRRRVSDRVVKRATTATPLVVPGSPTIWSRWKRFTSCRGGCPSPRDRRRLPPAANVRRRRTAGTTRRRHTRGRRELPYHPRIGSVKLDECDQREIHQPEMAVRVEREGRVRHSCRRDEADLLVGRDVDQHHTARKTPGASAADRMRDEETEERRRAPPARRCGQTRSPGPTPPRRRSAG